MLFVVVLLWLLLLVLVVVVVVVTLLEYRSRDIVCGKSVRHKPSVD